MLAGKKIVNQKLTIAISLTLAIGSTAVTASTHTEKQIHHAAEDAIEEVLVWGRASKQIGEAPTASAGLVGFGDFKTRPLQRIGEFTEVAPGMVATQHSGEGKANQYYLRGMNLDHGTDFSAYLAGMPINLRGHAHGQGYLDLNFLIPEIINSVAFRKGPYYADRGDFSTVGTTTFNLYERIEEPFIKADLGAQNYRRLVTAGSVDVGRGHLLSALEIATNDGPWELPAGVQKRNALFRFSRDFTDFNADLFLSYYANSWRATDQIPRRSVASKTLDRFGFVDPDLGGRSQRLNFITNLENEHLNISAYISQYALNLFSNFTYFAEDLINGDQLEQVDRRWIFGGNSIWRMQASDRLSIRLGIDLRSDKISAANLYQTTSRKRRNALRRDRIGWDSVGLFSDLTWQWHPRLRSTMGIRVDHNRFDVKAQLPANSGRGNDTLVSPSFNSAFQFNDSAEIYVSWGAGFHSNDVRGVTIKTDPATLEPAQAVDLFAPQRGAEVGLRTETEKFNGTVVYFWLQSDSELLFVGDSGATEASQASERSGLELTGFWQFKKTWTADLNASWVNSRFSDVPKNEQSIPNAHGRVIGAGITYAESAAGLTASLRLKQIGDAPLVEDDSIAHSSATIVNAGISHSWDNWEVGVDVFNLFDAQGDDIAYYFESQLANEINPVADTHFHPILPRTARATIKWQIR